jgi:hypothetical protein
MRKIFCDGCDKEIDFAINPVSSEIMVSADDNAQTFDLCNNCTLLALKAVRVFDVSKQAKGQS